MTQRTVAPERTRDPEIGETWKPDKPWLVIVHNDPINLMSYVTWVFQTLFGYPLAKAHKLMMDVHTKGKAVVANGSQDEAERHVARLHAYGLWATMQQDR